MNFYFLFSILIIFQEPESSSPSHVFDSTTQNFDLLYSNSNSLNAMKYFLFSLISLCLENSANDASLQKIGNEIVVEIDRTGFRVDNTQK